MNTTFLMPLALLAAGGAGWIIVGRRRFNRRNFAGIEEFNGYGSMLIARFIERIIRVASGVALVMGVVGLATIPGQLRHSTAVGPSAATPTNSSSAGIAPVPVGAHRAVLLASKCYFYDRNSRLLAVQPLAASHRACAIPTALRA